MAESDKSGPSGISAAFANLPDTIRQFWEAVAWPLFELAVAIVTLSYVLRLDLAHLPVPSAVPQKNGAIADAIDLYGLKTLIPIAVLIILLGIAQANSKLLRILGSLLPFRLVGNDEFLLAKHSDKAKLAAIWDTNPNADGAALSKFLDIEIERPESADPNRAIMRGSRYIRAKMCECNSVAQFLRGLLVVTVAVALFLYLTHNLYLSWIRIWTATTVICVLLIFITSTFIQLTQRYNERKVLDYYSFMQLVNSRSNKNDKEINPPSDKWTLIDEIREKDPHREFGMVFSPGSALDDLTLLAQAWGRLSANPGQQ